MMKEPEGVSAIDFLRTRSLANVVQAEIERMIIEGELKPNERVNENALSQRLGVSRGPIREACSALGAMGLIEIIPNRGFFIRALTNDEALDLSKAAGRWLLANRPLWLGAGDAPATGLRRGLVVLGRWSLSYYLLHQPVMIGLLAAFVWWRG